MQFGSCSPRRLPRSQIFRHLIRNVRGSFETRSDLPTYLFLDNSDRVAVKGQKLFPPYTQLGWDQSALGLGDIDIEDVSQVHHIVGYGRPL